MMTRSVRAFTLVEMLIVTVILGVLATLAIAHFTVAYDDARQSSLDKNVAIILRALERYKMDHLGKYPESAATVAFGLIHTSKIDGTPGGDFGRYLNKIPDNPFTETNNITAQRVQVDGTNASAWYYPTTDGSDGTFLANHGL